MGFLLIFFVQYKLSVETGLGEHLKSCFPAYVVSLAQSLVKSKKKKKEERERDKEKERKNLD